MKKLIRITTVPISLDKLLGKQLSFMNRYFEVTAVSSDKDYLDKVAKRLGIKSHHVEMTRKITPFRDLYSIYNLYLFFRKEKPQIVHTHTPKAGLVGMTAAYFAGVPVRLHTVAGLPLLEKKGWGRKILNVVEKITYNFATKVYPNSFELERIIVKNKFCSPKKLKVIGNGSSNGIDLNYFSESNVPKKKKEMLLKKLKISDKDFVFIFVGRLVKDKGINELVSAFKKLSLEYAKANTFRKNPKLLLVGPLEQHLNPLAPETLEEIEYNENIISMGYKEEVLNYYAISDALVFPSYREGFPNVVLQAGAMNLPSIVTDINGCNEIVENGKNGIVIPVKNSHAVFTAMKKIMTDEDFYVRLKFQSRERIQEKYSQEKVWELLKQEYDSFQI